MTPSRTPLGPDLSGQCFASLIDVIAALLAPMFLGLSGGDIGLARTAAIETLNAYRAQNLADLLSAAQIIAFGLAALGSLSLSMTGDVSPAMAVRLRSSATALNRSAEQNRRALRESHCAADAVSVPEGECPGSSATDRNLEDIGPGWTEPFLSVAAARELAAEAHDRRSGAERPYALNPSPPPGSTSVPAADRKTADRAATERAAADRAAADKRHRAIWAIAMVKEAGELSARIPNLPPAERHAASVRAAALGGIANTLLTGADLTPAVPAEAPPPDPILFQR